ncbi:MAG: hypothetical protein E7604_03865 [Ruminococcaceae bacterium]|nr:hypothetical protein [Oscillospiraceae bacterium]
MRRNHKRHRVPSPLQDNILSLIAIVSLIVLTLAAVSGVLWMLIRTGMLSYEWGLFDPQTTDTVAFDDADGVFDALRPVPLTSDGENTADTAGIVRFSGSFSTLRKLLSDLNTADHYNALYETVLHTDTANAASTVRLYRSGASYRVTRHAPGVSTAGQPTESYVCDGTAVVYTDHRTQSRARFPVSDAFSPEALAGIPSVASFNAIPDERILHASYTEQDGEFLYYVMYTTPTADNQQIVHEIWISAEAELVRRCCTYLCPANRDPMTVIADDSARLFSSVLRSVTELSARERQVLFVLPEVGQ